VSKRCKGVFAPLIARLANTSYLTDRSQFIHVGSESSAVTDCPFCVEVCSGPCSLSLIFLPSLVSQTNLVCLSVSTQMTRSCTLPYRKRPSMMQSPTYKTVCSTFTRGSIRLVTTRKNPKRCPCQLYSMLERRLRR